MLLEYLLKIVQTDTGPWVRKLLKFGLYSVTNSPKEKAHWFLKTHLLLKWFYWRAWTNGNHMVNNFWTVFIKLYLFFIHYALLIVNHIRLLLFPEEKISNLRSKANKYTIEKTFTEDFLALFHLHFNILQIHFKAYEICILSLFAVTFQYFCYSIYFFENINAQICIVLAIFKYTCPFSQTALRFLTSSSFSFSPVLLFSASIEITWNGTPSTLQHSFENLEWHELSLSYRTNFFSQW